MKKLTLFLVFLTVLAGGSSANEQSGFLLELFNDTYQSVLKADSGIGLPNDRYNNSSQGNYSSPEEAGFYMLSHIGAAENNLISKITARDRIDKTLKTLEGLPTEQGLYYRYYDTSSPNYLKPNDGKTEVPSIGNAMLVASLMTTARWADENNFTELSDSCSHVMQSINLAVFYDNSSNRFYQDLDKDQDWDYYSAEGRLLSFVARCLGYITEPEFKDNLDNLIKPNLFYNVTTNATIDPADHLNISSKDINVKCASWDGSMFTYLAPSLFINETQTNYQKETINPAVKAQMIYANRSGFRLNGKMVWGISAAYNTSSNYCSRYCGAPPTKAHLQSPEFNPYQDCPGMIAPYASALALLSDYSDNATENLISLSQKENLYDSTFGFKDSFNANTGDAVDLFVTLDQEWILLALMNKLNGTIWRYFYQNPEVVAAHDIMYPAANETAASKTRISENT